MSASSIERRRIVRVSLQQRGRVTFVQIESEIILILLRGVKEGSPSGARYISIILGIDVTPHQFKLTQVNAINESVERILILMNGALCGWQNVQLLLCNCLCLRDHHNRLLFALSNFGNIDRRVRNYHF